MPLYDYKCPACGRKFDTFKKISERDQPEICTCGVAAERQITKTLAVRGMFEPYISEASGRLISSPSQRRDDLARTGCIEYDPEMRKDVQRINEEAERKLDQTLEESLHQTLSTLGA